MTRLEKIILNCTGINTTLKSNVSRNQWQQILDDAAAEIMTQVSTADILGHMVDVYDETATEYEQNPHNKDVIDELPIFMDTMPNGSHVLDVGCATGRDALFMSIADYGYRNSLMGRIKNGKTTREKFIVPQKTFNVKGLDGSKQMLTMARAKTYRLTKQGLLSFQSSPMFKYGDMHNIDPMVFPGGPSGYDGIWSCAALFTHTPISLLDSTIKSLVQRLMPGGLFFTSYTNGRASGGRYDKLLLSSTERVKYFSQPDPDQIAQIASKHGLVLERQAFSDMEVQGKVVKPDLFVSQFFRKVA